MMPTPESSQAHPLFTCPICGSEPKSFNERTEAYGPSDSVRHADCVCPADHLWIVRWLAVA